MSRRWSGFLRILAAGIGGFLVFDLAEAQKPPEKKPKLVQARVEVVLPAKTPADPIYLAGNLPDVGAWKADGFMLTRIHDTMALGWLLVPLDTPLEFKITRGSWATVEKGPGFEEIGNRIAAVTDTQLSRDGPMLDLRVLVATWADRRPPQPPTFTGTIKRHDDFASNHLGNRRTIHVYLPPGYHKSADRYPVLYVHDGQNVFDSGTSFTGVEWGVDERCEEMITKGEIEPVIVVAIDNAGGERIMEYTPAPDSKRGGGKGELYARFLIEEVKPFIDTTYRTLPGRPHTAVMGSSLGGLISLHLAWRHADVFAKVAAVSPSLWWADSEMVRHVESSRPASLPDRLWIDMGTVEGMYPQGYLSDVEKLGKILEGKGFTNGSKLAVRIFDGAGHSERAWAERTGEILKFLFGK